MLFVNGGDSRLGIGVAMVMGAEAFPLDGWRGDGVFVLSSISGVGFVCFCREECGDFFFSSGLRFLAITVIEFDMKL